MQAGEESPQGTGLPIRQLHSGDVDAVDPREHAVAAPRGLRDQSAAGGGQRRADGQAVLGQGGEHGEVAASGGKVDVQDPAQAEHAARGDDPPVAVHHPLGDHLRVLHRAQPEHFRQGEDFAPGRADSVLRHRATLPGHRGRRG
ncbi:hypothetical protein GCM10022416_28070 [Actinomadura keratinilytica]|uniref:Uncharacterized protein n=1 Tax=Actinomadura keratinilytica TaxID=547461 RepID=A0ABP7YSQ8_9ACTN